MAVTAIIAAIVAINPCGSVDGLVTTLKINRQVISRSLGDQPSSRDGKNENRNSQDLCRIYAAMTHHEGTDDHDVSGHVRREDA